LKNIGARCALVLAFAFIFAPTIPAVGQASSKPKPKAAAKHPWASFNPGSWVKIKSTTVNEVAGKQETNVLETKITLLEKTADKVVLETEITVKGQTTKTRSEMPLKGYSDAVPPGVMVLNRGSETIVIGGNAVPCKTMETSMDAMGTKILSKTWSSEKVPGSLVKSVNSTTGSQTTAEVVDFKAL
jgi:hypothetical protein